VWTYVSSKAASLLRARKQIAGLGPAQLVQLGSRPRQQRGSLRARIGPDPVDVTRDARCQADVASIRIWAQSCNASIIFEGRRASQISCRYARQHCEPRCIGAATISPVRAPSQATRRLQPPCTAPVRIPSLASLDRTWQCAGIVAIQCKTALPVCNAHTTEGGIVEFERIGFAHRSRFGPL
jgi:hypothetical protein